MSDPAPPRMPPAQVRFVAVMAAATAFAAGFAWPSFQAIPVLWYAPLEHRWSYEVAGDPIAMDWYGRTLLASAVALAAFFLAGAVARRLRPLGQRGHILWTAWMATTVVLAMALYTHQLATRRPVPAPLPSWYVPK